MKPKNDRTQPERPATAEPPAPRKRFRITKLEERIAPGAVDTKKCYTVFKCTAGCF
jgi:hypothetical protein